jgi:hypothetical protein
MTNERLLFEAWANLETATQVVKESWKVESISHERALKLQRHLQQASAAAQELERRAAGCPPPKVG